MTQPPYSRLLSPHDAQPNRDRPLRRPFCKRPGVIVLGVVVAVGLVGCKAEDTAPAAASTPPAVTTSAAAPPTTEAAVQPVAPPPTTEPAPRPVNFAMPNFVGTDLQTAQNLVQTNGVFLSLSHDLLGSRNQLVDSNWMVCDQNIPAGQQVSGDVEGKIDFGVVKREESCP
jgi:hypothetical protein